MGADRFMYVPAELVMAAKELMAKYPTGALFRTERDVDGSVALRE